MRLWPHTFARRRLPKGLAAVCILVKELGADVEYLDDDGLHAALRMLQHAADKVGEEEVAEEEEESGGGGGEEGPPKRKERAVTAVLSPLLLLLRHV